jgi:hypothetical protein
VKAHEALGLGVPELHIGLHMKPHEIDAKVEERRHANVEERRFSAASCVV